MDVFVSINELVYLPLPIDFDETVFITTNKGALFKICLGQIMSSNCITIDLSFATPLIDDEIPRLMKDLVH